MNATQEISHLHECLSVRETARQYVTDKKPALYLWPGLGLIHCGDGGRGHAEFCIRIDLLRAQGAGCTFLVSPLLEFGQKIKSPRTPPTGKSSRTRRLKAFRDSPSSRVHSLLPH